jgi:cytochrome c biogenesis protein
LFRAVWDFLNSLKLTVYLILGIVGITMLGSFILYFNQQIFGDMDQSLLFRWLYLKGPSFPAYTWWLYILVAMVVLLGFNTLVCTIERLPALVKRYRDPYLNMRDLDGAAQGREISGVDTPSLRLTERLRREGYSVFIQDGRLYAEKNRWVPFMPYLVHAGIMVFMIAHLISGIYGYRNSGLMIFQGDTVKSPAGDWKIRVDEVKVDYRDDGSLKDFGSKLTAIKDGREIKTAWTKANMPMFVEGGAIYQREFGYGFRGVYIRANIPSLGYDDYVFVPTGATMADLGNTGYSISVDRFLPDTATDNMGYYTKSQELNNPSMMVSVYHKSGKRVASGWLFLKEPNYNTYRSADVGLSFADLDMRPYSVFEVNRDPGAITALFASLIVMFGTVVTLYFRRERAWASFDDAAGTAQLVCTDDEAYEGVCRLG